MGKMSADPQFEEPLDPSRVVLDRSWSVPSVREQVDLDPRPTGDAWAAGLASKPASPSTSWLDGLVREEASTGGEGWLSGLVKEESSSAPSGPRSWLAGLIKEVVPPPPRAETTSWLAGLVKQETRPAVNDIARLIFGNSGELPSPHLSPSFPSPPPVAPAPAELGRKKSSKAEILGATESISVAPRSFSPPEPRPMMTSSLEDRRPGPPEPSGLPRPPLRLPEINLLEAPTSVLPEPSLVANLQSVAALVSHRQPRIAARDKVTFYSALTSMFDAGVPLFAIFEFLAREGESLGISKACRSISQNLVAGMPLHSAAAKETNLFDLKAVRLLEVGYRGGKLPMVLARLAVDEERAWTMRQKLRSQLVYPCGIALVTLVAVMLLPPLALTPLLEQIVSLTAEPPFVTRCILSVSAFVSSPFVLLSAGALSALAIGALRTPRGRAFLINLELAVWFVPSLGPLWRNLVALRFLRVFAMTYESGLAAATGMELATAASGSQMAYRIHPLMKKTLIDGGSLTESFQAGGFLPALALEAIHAGEVSGKVPLMLENTALILEAEVESRIDAVAKMIEPLVLAVMGAFVAVFVLGCMLPIVELTEKL